MEYPVAGSPPNVVDGVALGYLDTSGNFVPITAAVPMPVSGLPTSLGQKTMALSLGVAIASDQSAVPVSILDISNAEYETVAAGQTAQVLGGTGATGDYLGGLLVTPASTSPGVVTILDNATSINVFAGGASSLSNLVPFFIPIGAKSVSGAWKVTTGSNVSVVAVGNFSA